MNVFKRIPLLINIILSTLVLIVFSFHWFIPVRESLKNPTYSYKPIFYSAATGNDDYFYYSRIREFIDGSFFSGDHATLEHRHEFTPHASYSLSFFLASLGGVVTGKTEHAYYFNYVVYPLLTFWLVFYLSQLLGLSPFIGSALSFIVTLDTPSLFRTPNSLITSPLLVLFFIVLFMKFEEKRPSRKIDIALILLLGLSAVTSMPNMFIAYSFFVTCLIFYWWGSINRVGFLKMFALSLILSIPGFYVIIQNILGSNPDWFGLAIPPLEKYSGIREEYVRPVLHMLGKPYLYFLYLVIHFRHKRYIFSIIVSFLLIYVFLLYTRGSYTSYYIFNRGGEVVFTFIRQVFPFLVLDTVLREKEFKLSLGNKTLFTLPLLWVRKIPSFIFPLLFLIYLGKTVYRFFPLVYSAQKTETLKKIPYYNRPDFNRFVDWTVKNTNHYQVAVSTDFDVNVHLGVYSPLCTYLPFAHHSPTSTQERHHRLFEVFAFFGLSKDDVFNLFHTMKVRNVLMPEDSEADLQSALMQLMVYYGPYSHLPMPDTEAKMLAENYEFVRKDFKGFTFASHYLILSKFTERYVKPGSQAERLISTKAPLFKNALYSIYPL